MKYGILILIVESEIDLHFFRPIGLLRTPMRVFSPGIWLRKWAHSFW